MRSVLLLAVLVVSPLAMQTTAPPANIGADQWLAHPVDDRTFKNYLTFFTYDRQLRFETKVAGVENEGGLRRERLSFQSTPGVRVTAFFHHASGTANEKPPGLVLLHGGGPTGKENVLRAAELFARAGWSVLSIDLLYFGERTTPLLTTFSDQEKYDKLYNQPSVYLSWITQSVKDVRRGLDFMVQERGIDPRRTGMAGASRGAIVATIAAGVDDRLSPVLLIYGGHGSIERDHLPPACPANYIGRIAPRPVLMINGTQDAVILKESSVDPLFRLARQPKQIIWTDGGHMFMNEEHRAAMVQWLREHQK
jgi:pimeloyl-ACP methyl ester carboxylesterase